MGAPFTGWSRRTLAVIIGLGFVLSYIAGFLTYRARLQTYVKPLIAFALRDTGGCSLSQSYSALNTSEFDAVQARLRNSSKVVEKTPDGLFCVKTEQGTFWVPPGNDYAFVLAEQAVRIYGDGEYRVQPGDTVLDCGANIGTFTREALNAGAGLVIAIEPVPAHVEALRRTFKNEIEQGRVRVIAKGVWNKEDTLEMNLFDNALLDSFVMAERPEESTRRRISLPSRRSIIWSRSSGCLESTSSRWTSKGRSGRRSRVREQQSHASSPECPSRRKTCRTTTEFYRRSLRRSSRHIGRPPVRAHSRDDS